MKIRQFLIFVVCALVAGVALRYGVKESSQFGSIAGHTARLQQPIPAYTRSLHPNYPYSIIPGGAYSAAELRYANQEDPLVKEHYADFDMKNVRMVQLTEDRYQYVSYRLHQKVFWTKKKLLIPKGELLLTDGATWARARCGNRLSEKPHGQLSIDEPPAKALSMPPMHLGTPMELAETPPLGGLSSIPPGLIDRFPPVLPPTFAQPPTELPPLAPIPPVTPVMPIVPMLFPPVTAPRTSDPVPKPPVTTPPIGSPNPPTIIPPTGNPPISSVPEPKPKTIYLFIVTFVGSLYGLTRMMLRNEKTETPTDDQNHHY